jgi:hypothetical protein
VILAEGRWSEACPRSWLCALSGRPRSQPSAAPTGICGVQRYPRCCDSGRRPLERGLPAKLAMRTVRQTAIMRHVRQTAITAFGSSYRDLRCATISRQLRFWPKAVGARLAREVGYAHCQVNRNRSLRQLLQGSAAFNDIQAVAILAGGRWSEACPRSWLWAVSGRPRSMRSVRQTAIAAFGSSYGDLRRSTIFTLLGFWPKAVGARLAREADYAHCQADRDQCAVSGRPRSQPSAAPTGICGVQRYPGSCDSGRRPLERGLPAKLAMRTVRQTAINAPCQADRDRRLRQLLQGSAAFNDIHAAVILAEGRWSEACPRS